MPISPQQYNIRIGSFIENRNKKIKYRKHSSKFQSKYKHKKIPKIILIIYLVIVSTAVIISANSSDPSNSVPDCRHLASWPCPDSTVTLSSLQVCNSVPDYRYLASWPCPDCASTPSSLQSWEEPQSQNCNISQAWMPLSNLIAHCTYGNRSGGGRGIRLAAWNAGSAFLQNKINEIELAISDSRPHILTISEANFHLGHDVENVKINGYDILFSKTLQNDNLRYSRIVVYKHESIVAKVRADLMDESVSSIWLELGFKHQRKILLGSLYREWQLLGQTDKVSGSSASQLERWKAFLSQWEQALGEGRETVVMGDINIDWLTCFDIDPAPNSTAARNKPLVDEYISKIVPHGVVQCVRGITRSWPGQRDSQIDLLFTNVPEKMSPVQTLVRASSDHRYVSATRYAKNIKSSVRYARRRSYKNFEEARFTEDVKQIKWWDLYHCQDAERQQKYSQQRSMQFLIIMIQ